MPKDIKNGAEDGRLERKIKFRKNFWKWKPVFQSLFSPAFAHSPRSFRIKQTIFLIKNCYDIVIEILIQTTDLFLFATFTTTIF